MSTLIALLDQRRHVGQQRRALGAEHADHLDLAALLVLHDVAGGHDAGRHLAADQIGGERAVALVGHDVQLDAGGLAQLQPAEVGVTAEAGRAEQPLLRIGLDPGDVLLGVVARRSSCRPPCASGYDTSTATGARSVSKSYFSTDTGYSSAWNTPVALGAIMYVVPSGALFFSASAARRPPAPGLLSTITVLAERARAACRRSCAPPCRSSHPARSRRGCESAACPGPARSIATPSVRAASECLEVSKRGHAVSVNERVREAFSTAAGRQDVAGDAPHHRTVD